MKILAVLLFVVVIAGSIWWQVYRFHDCRHVGHSRLYCVMTLGR